MCVWRVYRPVFVIYDTFNYSISNIQQKRRWVLFSRPWCVRVSPRMKGSVWADPAGQMCDRCRPYRSAAPGRFTLAFFYSLIWRRVCACARVRESVCGGRIIAPTFFCADRWGEIIAVINEHGGATEGRKSCSRTGAVSSRSLFGTRNRKFEYG